MAHQSLTDARSPAYTPGLKRPPNIKALTSVRFFAALYVALFHLVRPFTLWGPLAGFMGAGYVGVSFFFLLSGFILTYSHAHEYELHRGSAVKFWVARIARIYPVYLLSLLFAVAIRPSDLLNKHALAFLADLFMAQSWSMRLVLFFNPPAWSISVEAFFYLLFPFVLLRLRPSSARRALLAVIGFWVLAMTVPLLAVLHWPAATWANDSTGRGELHVFQVAKLPIFAAPEFLAGISLGWYYLNHRPGPKVASSLASAGLVATLSALLLADHLPGIMLNNGLLIPLFAMLLLGLGEQTWLSKALEHPVLILLGEASFALYLFHVLLTMAFPRLQAGTFSAALCALAVVVPFSVLLHIYVERPGRRVILSWWRQRHPDQTAIAP